MNALRSRRTISGSIALLVTLCFGIAAADDAAAPKRRDAALSALLAEFKRPGAVPSPASNPTTPAKVELGKALFFDPRLSGSGIISCGTCHNPSLGWADGLPLGRGHMGATLSRHTPTVLNVAFGEPYFWDGRAATLEDQAKGPLVSEAEMNMPPIDVVNRVQASAGYRKLFTTAYPGQPISMDTIAGAIAAFERTVVSAQAPFDRWVAGDERAVGENAKRGFALFAGKARCANCHMGWRFSDDGFHDIGLASKDLGRASIVNGIVQMQHAFKTPTLRNIVDHAPYMHDGSVATLQAVVEHYNDGFVRRESLDADMVPLQLSAAEIRDLIAFMEALSSVDPPTTLPTLPH